VGEWSFPPKGVKGKERRKRDVIIERGKERKRRGRKYPPLQWILVIHLSKGAIFSSVP